MWSTLEPVSVTVDAGDTATVWLRIRNTGDIVEEYHIDMVGDPASWCVIEPVSLRLYPGTTGSVSLSFTPPRSPDATAGPHPYGVRISPVENPDTTTVVEGNLTVTAFVDVRAELLPTTVRGWLRGKPTLAVDNYGNTGVTAAVLASTNGDALDFDIRTPSVQIQPGRAHFSKLRVKPNRLLWLGQRSSHRFTTVLQPSGSPAVPVDGTYLQSALLPRWLGRLLMVLLALVLAFVGLWFAAKPSVGTKATAKAAPAARVIPPTSSATPSTTTSTTANTTASTTASTTHHSGAGSRPSMPKPVGYWALTNDTPSSANDLAGDHNGIATNANWASGCTNFDGKDSQIVTNGPVLNTGPGASYTVAVNVYAEKSSNFMTFVAQDGPTASTFYLQYSAADNRWAFSNTKVRALSDSPPAWQTWTKLVGVYNAATGEMQIYVNGIAEGTAFDDSPIPSTGDLTMGRAKSSGNPADWYLGAMNNVVVYQQALTAAQVRQVP